MLENKNQFSLITVAIILLSIKTVLSYSSIIAIPSLIDDLFIVLALGIFALKIYHSSFTSKELIFYITTGAIIAMTSFKIKEYDLFLTFVTLYLIKDGDIKTHIKTILYTEGILIALSIVIALGLTLFHSGDAFWIATESRTLRFNGGLGHPNVLSSFIMSFMMMYAYLKYEDLDYKDYIAFVIITFIAYLITRTRTTLLLSILLVGMLLLWKKKSKLVKFFEKYQYVAFPMNCMFMYLMIKAYFNQSSIVSLVNKILSGRIRLAAYAYARSGISILPKYIDYIGHIQWSPYWLLNDFTFDNLYAYFLVELGILWIILFSVVFYYLMKKTEHKDHLFLFIWLMYAFTEVHGLNCYKFFPILLFVALLPKVKKYD